MRAPLPPQKPALTKALVIDRDDHIRKFVCLNLSIHGFDVLETPTLEDATRLLNLWQPAVIVLEIPFGSDIVRGEWLTSLTGLHLLNGIPLIAFTTELDELDELRAFNPNIAAVILKPATASHLMDTVHSVLNESMPVRTEDGRTKLRPPG